MISLSEHSLTLGDDPAAPAVTVRRRHPLACPVVFSTPHSGRTYPASMMAASRLDARDIRLSEDAWVDALIAPATEIGVALVEAGYARAFVDLNRGPEELDPAMFEGAAPDPAPTRTARVAAGLGCIPRVVGDGRAIYRRRLPTGEAERRLDLAWRPYHAALEALVEEARTTFGRAVLIDWHSMPGAAATRRGFRADVVLGDRHGAACGGALIQAAQSAFEGMGYRVVRNAPYAGGWTTERYGRPDEGVHALQIELSRRLYLNEATLERTAGFERVRRDLLSVAKAVVDVAPRL